MLRSQSNWWALKIQQSMRHQAPFTCLKPESAGTWAIVCNRTRVCFISQVLDSLCSLRNLCVNHWKKDFLSYRDTERPSQKICSIEKCAVANLLVHVWAETMILGAGPTLFILLGRIQGQSDASLPDQQWASYSSQMLRWCQKVSKLPESSQTYCSFSPSPNTEYIFLPSSLTYIPSWSWTEIEHEENSKGKT